MTRMHKYGESNTTRIMMAAVHHVTAWAGHTKYQAAWFFWTECTYLPSKKAYEMSTNNILIPSKKEARDHRPHWRLGPWSSICFLIIRPFITSICTLYCEAQLFSSCVVYFNQQKHYSVFPWDMNVFRSVSKHIGRRHYNEAGMLQCSYVIRVKVGSNI
jgi:hypothetical protein